MILPTPPPPPESLETTRVFTAGVTRKRIEQVAKILPTALNRRGIMPNQEPVAMHPGPGGVSSDHYGWLIEQVIFRGPRSGVGSRGAHEGARSYTTILPYTPGGSDLVVCVNKPEVMEDVSLDRYALEAYDGALDAQPKGSLGVSEQARLFHSSRVGEILTDFVLAHGLWYEVHPYAIHDQPVPGND